MQKYISDLTLQPPNYSIWIFTHLKLCLADAIHNFKGVKIIQIWQNGGQLFSNLADWCHVLSSICLKADMPCANKNCKKTNIICTGGRPLINAPITWKKSNLPVHGRDDSVVALWQQGVDGVHVLGERPDVGAEGGHQRGVADVHHILHPVDAIHLQSVT